MGVPILELDRDELLATIGHLIACPKIEPSESLLKLVGRSDSIPRWRNEDVEEFLDDRSGRYEAALETHEKLIRELRDAVQRLELENDRLKWELMSPKRRYMRPPIISFFGFQMESADVD